MSEFRITQDYTVFTPRKQGAYPIQESDWMRLKQMVQGIVPAVRIFQILSSIFLGIFASSIFSLLGFLSATQIAPWILTTAWVIFWVSLLVGSAMLLLDFKQKDMVTFSTKTVVGEMERLEQHFDRPENEAGGMPTK
ncbi:MAG: hypothetical protein M1378_00565 [Bacteroidetes bacterium]|nr:hypothetical protein [Bacteroidota bacterium]